MWFLTQLAPKSTQLKCGKELAFRAQDTGPLVGEGHEIHSVVKHDFSPGLSLSGALAWC